MSTLTKTAIGEVLDLDRYPLDRLDSPRGQLLLESCRAALRFEGACQLPGLVKADAVARLVEEALSKNADGHRTDDTHNVYFEKVNTEAPADDPASILEHSSKSAVGWDKIDADSPLRIAFEWDGLTNFIGEAMEVDELHRYADPQGAASLMTFGEGDELGWHFDRSPFAVTLMLQPSLGGGEFQYFHMLRTSEDESKEAVVDRLKGGDKGRIKLSTDPGTLSMFRGHYSMHRVTPIEGDQPRINAVLAYSEKPGDMLNELTRELFYGRPSS